MRPTVPAVKNTRWARNEIDAFVLARLEAQGLEPAPEADRTTLVRRVWLDLAGLLPPVDEVTRFVADPAPDAYERLVDRLLASPHFGERWGRHWLDLARYADSSGYESDTPRSVWRYRDWVDPSDQSRPAVRQVHDRADCRRPVAERHGRSNDCERLSLQCDVRSGRALGIGPRPGQYDRYGFFGPDRRLAQCHSHKFDPLTQREYFQLYAFFDSASISPFELASAAEKAARDAAQARVDEIKTARDAYEKELKASVNAWAASLTADDRARLPPDVQAALSTGPGGRSPGPACHAHGLADRARFALPGADARNRPSGEAGASASGNAGHAGRAARDAAFCPREPRTAWRSRAGRSARVFASAAWSPTIRRGSIWPVGSWPADNPLVGRVTVNRIWQHDFGQGIVETADNFGMQTAAPVHRELLDWLATEFVARSWSVKAVHRLIVCSATYRQSSRQAARVGNRGPHQSPAGAPATAARRGGDSPRYCARCRRIVVGQIRRPECLSASTPGSSGRTGRPGHVDDQPGRGPLPARDVHLGLAVDAVPGASPVRRARRRDGLHAAGALEHAGAGADVAQ